MVLAGDEHPAGLNVTDGVVAAPVTVVQAARLGSGGQGQDLVAQADGEHGHAAVIQLLYLGDDSHVVGGVAGAVGQHHAVEMTGQHRLGGGEGGEHGDVAATAAQTLDHVLLHAEVHHGHPVLLLAIGGAVLGLFAGDPLHGALYPEGANFLQCFRNIKMLRTGDHAIHAPLTAEYFR